MSNVGNKVVNWGVKETDCLEEYPLEDEVLVPLFVEKGEAGKVQHPENPADDGGAKGAKHCP